MTTKEINKFRSEIRDLIDRGRLGEAFETLRNIARSVSSWTAIDRIERAEQGYSYLLRYLIDGVDDPSRDAVYGDIISETRTICDLLTRELSIVDTPTLYYNTLRSVNSHGGETLEKLYDDQRRFIEKTSPFGNLESSASESDILRSEMNERDIFNRLWVTFPMNIDDVHATADFIADESVPSRTRALAVSALTLGLLEFFDERRIRLLLDAYRSPDVRISVRALTGLVIALDKYRPTRLSAETLNNLAAIKELPGWSTDIHKVFVELIRTTDTRSLSARLNEEIFPNLQKMGRDISDRLKDASLEKDLGSGEMNPEWDEMLSDERILNNLKELGELQQEGADVFMTAFSQLKQFPFFNDAANWFLPYDPDHSSLSSFGSSAASPLAAMISTAPFICDSDKYSMAFSLAMMPESQKQMMTSQLEEHRREIDSMLASTAGGNMPVDRSAEFNNYIHSLYRFFNLFRRKGDFYNPFDHVANPIDITWFIPDFADEESLLSLSEFYFKIKLYDYALRTFGRLDEVAAPDASRYQKMGFCASRLGDRNAAASYYEQADLLDGSNPWNLRSLAAVYRHLGQFESAVSAAERLKTLEPDNAEVAANLGDLYLLADRIDDAINELRRSEFLCPDKFDYVRPLARALMYAHRFDDARSYYDRIIAEGPTSYDLIEAGHIAWAQNRLAEAISYYRLAADQTSPERFVKEITSDTLLLSRLGIDPTRLPLVIDATLYSLKQ